MGRPGDTMRQSASAVAADGAGWPAGTKWALGFLGFIVAAVLIWLLSHDGGLLNPEPPPTVPKAIVSFTDFDTAIHPRIGQNVGFTISNHGNAVASRCRIRGNTLDKREFTVPPRSSVDIVRTVYSSKLGVQTISYRVVCENSRSDTISKAVDVVESR
jgi:hypothetical protein